MDVRETLRYFGIPFRSEGPNVSKGNIVVKCPWCGLYDPSEHMGINFTTGEFGCWRSNRHSGNDFSVLLSMLANISLFEARCFIGAVDDSNIPERLAALDIVETDPEEQILAPGAGFRDLKDSPPRYQHYVTSRGIDLLLASNRYNIQASVYGQFVNRIIFPVLNQRGQLVGWTGRAIGGSPIRYLSHPEGEVIKNHLLFEPLLTGGRVLVITEGPFDAVKVDSSCYRHQINGTCLFGRNATSRQIRLLATIGKRYDSVLVMLDPDAWSSSIALAQDLAIVSPRIRFLSGSDPGGLSPEDIISLVSS